jgi:hypothetical protein
LLQLFLPSNELDFGAFGFFVNLAGGGVLEALECFF